MNLFVLTTSRRQQPGSPVLVEALQLLAARGWHVEVGAAEDMLLEPDHLSLHHDLYLLKSHSELSLNVASLLCAQGARVLHPYRNSLGAQNKIMAQQRLRAAGIPVPRSWITADLSLLAGLVDGRELIIKPHQGSRGAGIRVVRSRDELGLVPAPDKPVLIQEHVPGSGQDLKAYVVGEHVFTVHKAPAAPGASREGKPCPVTREVRDIARRCGEVLGLGVYGVDMIESPDGPVVVDVNYFPGFRGVANVAPLIADYVEAYAHGRRPLELRELRPAWEPKPGMGPRNGAGTNPWVAPASAAAD